MAVMLSVCIHAEFANRESMAQRHQLAFQLLDQFRHCPICAARCVWAGRAHRHNKTWAEQALKFAAISGTISLSCRCC